MIDQGQACSILAEMIKDEDKALIEYQQLKDSLGSKRDKLVIAKIMKDESRHGKKVRMLYNRIRCLTNLG